MLRSLRQELRDVLSPETSVLIVVAAPGEGTAILDVLQLSGSQKLRPWELCPLSPDADLLLTGVGKTCSAAGTAWALAKGRHSLVINVGIAGALPGASPLPLLSTVVATSHAFADEGVELPEGGFQTLAAMGFAPEGTARDTVPGDDQVAGALRRLLPDATPGPSATVSTCSGTRRLAEAVVTRTQAVCEVMEGAAVAWTALKLGARYGEVRVISNTTGDRPSQVWSLRPALAKLGEVTASLFVHQLP